MKTELSTDIHRAAELLRNGSLVAIPTETVYGLAANGWNEDAVRAVFRVKQRPYYDPLIVHAHGIGMLDRWGLIVPDSLRALSEAFWPGPLTLLIPRNEKVSDLITAALPRVAVRVPAHPDTRALLSLVDFPVVAPSANPFGQLSPTHHDHVIRYFDGQIPMVLAGGACKLGIESTIVGVEDKRVVIYRLGSLTPESISSVAGEVEVRTSSSRPEAPGMLGRHYAPSKPVFAVDTMKELMEHSVEDSAFVLFKLTAPASAAHTVHLSKSGSDTEAAQNFYEALAMWNDVGTVKRIVVERMPDLGLGRAINDRLTRASVTSSA